MKISYSKVSRFLACPRSYELRYVIGLAPRIKIPRMHRGSLVDKGLSEAIGANDEGMSTKECQMVAADEVSRAAREHRKHPLVAPFVKGIRSDLELIEHESSSIAMRAVRNLQLGEGVFESVKIDGKPAVQTRVSLTYSTFEFEGYIDWLPRRVSDGVKFLYDFKVRDNKQDEELARFDYQLPMYMFALNQLPGIGLNPVVNARHFQISSSPAKIPAQNKDGTTSRAKCATDPSTFIQTLQERGEDIEPFAHQIANLKPLDVTTSQVISTEEQSTVAAHFFRSTRALSDAETSGNFPMRYHAMQCGMCQYRRICAAEMRGQDPEEMMRVDFTTREERHAANQSKSDQP